MCRLETLCAWKCTKEIKQPYWVVFGIANMADLVHRAPSMSKWDDWQHRARDQMQEVHGRREMGKGRRPFHPSLCLVQVNSSSIQGRRTDFVFKYPTKGVLKSLTYLIYLVKFLLMSDCTRYCYHSSTFLQPGWFEDTKDSLSASWWNLSLGTSLPKRPNSDVLWMAGTLRLWLAGVDSAITVQFELKINRRTFSFSKQSSCLLPIWFIKVYETLSQTWYFGPSWQTQLSLSPLWV